ncbi:MAG: alpha/beta hydrolase [Aldersonia sp.]|nr:alpha/beta hydrolase [Aldersonia sp.]
MPIDERAVGSSVPVTRTVEVDGVPMSGLRCEATDPRAVIVALHGGGTTCAYWDCPGHPRLSLMRTAAAAGFTVLALDRPGYGSSAPYRDAMSEPQRRVDVTYAAIDKHLGSLPRGAGMFVWAHSIGCELAVRLATDERGRDLLGIELSGTGLEYHPTAHGVIGNGAQKPPGDRVRGLIWGPNRLYPAELIGSAAIASGGAAYEANVVPFWHRVDFPALATQVQVPVHFTAGEHEQVWRNDPDALRDIANLFTAAPRVETDRQIGGGHNLSLGYTAPAYHFRILSFVAECIVARDDPDFRNDAAAYFDSTKTDAAARPPQGR